MNVLIIGPALFDVGRGNRRTAVRWGHILTQLGHAVAFDDEYRDQDCDLLIALHAVGSASSMARFREQHPESPAILVLTGTDIYGLRDMFDEEARARSHGAMQRATRIVAMETLAVKNVPEQVRPKVRTILQSAQRPREVPARRGGMFEVCVVGELREVKDPFRTALAARQLPSPSTVRVVHAGAASANESAARAAKEEQVNARYTWLGEVSHQEALELIGRSRLLSISSRYESGPNILSEALAVGTPVIASRIPGVVGVLGDAYPGYFEAGDTEALSALLRRAETERRFYQELADRCRELAELASPAREVESWKKLLSSIA